MLEKSHIYIHTYGSVHFLPEYVEHSAKQLILVLPSGGLASKQFVPKKQKIIFPRLQETSPASIQVLKKKKKKIQFKSVKSTYKKGKHYKEL